MRKIIILIAFCLMVPAMAFSQYYWDYGARAGVANSLTDIGGKDKTAQAWILDMKMQETRWNFGGYVRWKIRDPFSIEGDLDYIRLQGADSLSTNPARHGRNCNFKNDMFDLTFKGTWSFYENPDLGNTYRYQNAFGAYLFLGISTIYSNPKGYGDPPGGHGYGWYSLRPLKTEAQSKEYSIIQLGIPVGAGFHFTLSKIYRVGFEMAWTETFTNHLDDISGNYPTAAEWANMSPEAQYFSNRNTPASLAGSDIKSNNYGPPPAGANYTNLRGKKGHDSFLTATATFGYVIRGRSNFYRAHYGGLFSKGKYRIRRRRAKF